MNNQTDNNINIGEVNWKHFPNIHELSQYLVQPDLIQLSLTCSHFRNKLNSTIFRKLQLIKGGKIIPGKPNMASMRKQLKILIDILEDDYLNKYHLVKHCILWEPCNGRFNSKLFDMFAYVTKLELYSSTTGLSYLAPNTSGSSRLIDILKPLKMLEVLILGYKLISFNEADSISNYKLPTRLKVLNVVGYLTNNLSFDPIENINGEYTELKKVTIINNKMLANVSASINSLTEVIISSSIDFSPKLLTQLFLLNTQLKKITISQQLIDSNVINSILQLMKLHQLNIVKYRDANTNELKNLVTNRSIRNINISCNISQNLLIPILSSIKSLHTLEVSNCSFNSLMDINWSSYGGKIPLLHINCVWNTDYKTDELLKLSIFDKIRFTNNFSLERYFDYNLFGELEGWEIIQDDPSNRTEFYIARKL